MGDKHPLAMKPVEFKLIMNTSQSAEACTVEIKGSNGQVSLCHFKEEVSCEIVKSQGPADNLLPLRTLSWMISNGGGYRISEKVRSLWGEKKESPMLIFPLMKTYNIKTICPSD